GGQARHGASTARYGRASQPQLQCEGIRGTSQLAAGPSSGVVVEAEGGEALGVVDPVVAHLDEQEQVDAALQHRLQLAAGAGADGFDPAAALAEHDRALAGAAHIDDLVDADAAVLALLPRFGLNR